MEEIIERIMSPDKFSIFLFTLGFSLLVTVTGIISGLKFLGLSAPSPRSRKEKLLMGITGAVLVIWAFVVSLSLPVYKPGISKRIIYAGNDAKQVVADGEDVYLLKDDGISRISQNRLQLIDSDKETMQISPAGGVLYILKDNGNIWSYVSVLGRTPTEKDSFRPKDDGTRTKQLVSAGETLYILKESGNIWKYYSRPEEKDMTVIHEKYVWIDSGTNTKQIASSGSILYILKERDGEIWQYVPTREDLFAKIYPPDNEEGKAIFIAADGGTLYFIKDDGSTWKYKTSPSIIEKKERAKEIDAVGGILYILTNEGEIFRYNTDDDDLRKLTEAGTDNAHIAAFGQDVFVIKKEDGGVWRYNEYVRRR